MSIDILDLALWCISIALILLVLTLRLHRAEKRLRRIESMNPDDLHAAILRHAPVYMNGDVLRALTHTIARGLSDWLRQTQSPVDTNPAPKAVTSPREVPPPMQSV